MSKSNIKSISLNVRGINELKKRRSVFNYLRRKNADVIFLQETFSDVTNEREWSKEWGGKTVFVHGTKHSCGVAVLFKKGLDCQVDDCFCDRSGRYIVLKVKIADEIYVLVNVYAPCTENQQVQFFRGVRSQLFRLGVISLDNIIVGGDFNCVMSEADKMGGADVLKRKTGFAIHQIMDDFDLHDVWRVKNPNARAFTWRQKTPRVCCRLDFWLVSDHLQDKVVDVSIEPSIRSDHSLISVTLGSKSDNGHGKGYWKLNSSLCIDSEYITKIKERLLVWINEVQNENAQQRWELIKYNIRKFSISFCKARSKRRLEREVECEKRLIELEKDMVEPGANLDTLDRDYEEVKKELEQLHEYKAQGAAIRSRAQWREMGEKSSKYFLNLEKYNGVRKQITALKIDGEVTEDPKAVNDHIITFYKNLYSAKATDEIESNFFLRQENIPKLDDRTKNMCEGLISDIECKKVLKSMKNNKAPGNDGITVEFYKVFWNDISRVFLDSINAGLDCGELSPSQRQGVITLLEKKGKDRQLIKNWRPITLLNNDYKIAAKVIAERMKHTLPNLIHHNQSAFVKNRYIGDSIRTVLDVISYLDRKDKEGLLLALDFEKAYDSIEWPFLLKSLKAFNFGDNFISWVKVFYNKSSSCIINNGLSTGYFDLKRGVRQGDPLSPYLFLVCVELFAIAVRNDDNIKGIKIGDEESKLAMYADDANALLEDAFSAKHLLKLADRFGKASGLWLNKEKTEALWLGSKKLSDEKPLGVIWPTTPLRVLGIYVSHNKKDVYDYNFRKCTDRLKAMLAVWRGRDLTLQGRVTIVKCLAISQVQFVTSFLIVPGDFIKEVNRILYGFIWKNGSEKIKRKVLIQDYKNGETFKRK
jgi:exonuclease III